MRDDVRLLVDIARDVLAAYRHAPAEFSQDDTRALDDVCAKLATIPQDRHLEAAEVLMDFTLAALARRR